MKIFWRAVTLMPNSVGHKLIRKNFKFSYQLPESLVFKIASSTDEIQQAFRIIHDGFVESKLMDENEAKLRITKFYCLPTTTLLVCKHEDEVIATISLIGDSAFGLPTEEFRDLSQYRAKGMKLAEISGLAIKKNNQSKRGRLLLPLFKYMFEYSRKIMNADALVISTTAEVKEFYRALFSFLPLDGAKVIKFSTVKNRETVSQILIVKDTYENLRKNFGHLPLERNLYHYFAIHQFKQFQFPKRQYPFAIDPIFSVDQIKHFFIEKTSVLEKMEEKEKILLAQYYPFEEHRKIILKNLEPAVSRRQGLRTPVSCPVRLNETHIAQVRDVSIEGLRIFCQEMNLIANETIDLTVDLAHSLTTTIQAQVMWSRGNFAGLRIVEASSHWKEMIEEAHRLYKIDKVVEVAA